MTKPPLTANALADHLLATDPHLRALAEELWRGQRRLRRVVGSEAFRLYLRIEEVANERLLALVERVWAMARTRDENPNRAHRAYRDFQHDNLV